MYDYYVIDQKYSLKSIPKGSLVLVKDKWNDFGFSTLFHMHYIDFDGQIISIGEIKIGFKGQERTKFKSSDYKEQTYDKIPKFFERIDEEFFSLGQSPEFYATCFLFFKDDCFDILSRINDLSSGHKDFQKYSDEEVFQDSLLRTVDIWQIKNQFSRILSGGNKLDNYCFDFNYGGKILQFDVEAFSSPPTNTHALIGRNGVGKTSILNSMFEELLSENINEFFKMLVGPPSSGFYVPVDEEYFSKVIYISYSIFGDYLPLIDDYDRFSYIGLKDRKKNNEYYIKNIEDLSKEFFNHLDDIKSSSSMTEMFEEILLYFSDSYDQHTIDSLLRGSKKAFNYIDFKALSSGHAVVLLVIVSLIASVIEKTLVLFDEPETHLHPPLLSALIRAINDILVKKNGVCIFATHSPVVLQEIPKSCVYTMRRSHDDIRFERPEVETFGEDVSTLTHEIFSLEVKATGFYNLLSKRFDDTNSVKEIKHEFNKQLGSEALSLLYLFEHNKIEKINGYPEL